MLKTALLVTCCSAAAFSAGVTGVTAYSNLSPSWPVGSALKVTPDPSNIWSWHKQVRLPRASGSGFHFEPILVDFDGNGKMDTENPAVRVFITDVQVWFDGFGSANGSPRPVVTGAWLADDCGRRWTLWSFGPRTENENDVEFLTRWHHFSTPLVLPVNSSLSVEFRFKKTGIRASLPRSA